jgi:phage shock protein PspC (stress-responsive transcriptional regulator)
MQKVVSINLNGNAYQLEEQGYDTLRAYLERAQSSLQSNPDRAEILADIEQAIAEKCALYLGPRKTVVSAAEVDTIIAEMGPVESAEAQKESSSQADAGGERARAPGDPPKRLYQIREGAMLTGVCKGLAAYFDVDVTLVRIIFVVLAFATFGLALLAYAVLAFIIPYADTAEQHAAAYGLSASAQAFVDQAKRKHESFRARHEGRREWNHRAWRRHWNRHYRHMAEQVYTAAAASPPPLPMSYGVHAALGVATPIFAAAHAAVFVAWAYVLLSVLTTGTVFGWPIPIDIPVWGSILILFVLYAVVTGPLRAMRHIGYGRPYAYHYPPFGALHSILWIGFTALFGWLAYQHIPQAHALIDSLPEAWHRTDTSSIETYLHLPDLSRFTGHL